MNNSIKSFVTLLVVVFMFSCGDYLDVAPDNIPTIDHAFKNRAEAEKYLYGLYGHVAVANPGSNPVWLGGDEVWTVNLAYAIEEETCWDIARGYQNTTNTLAGWYDGSHLYITIRDCNTFLENIDKPYDLGDEERKQWIGEVKFWKAFYHFWLFRMYGPIEVVRENLPISAPAEEIQRYREPVDDVVDYIVQLLDEAVELLPPSIEDVMKDMGRPDQTMVLALKAQVLTYAASPLFNCNEDYANYKDKRGVLLFPQDKSVERDKWKRAVDALKAAIDQAHATNHVLYDFNNNVYASVLNEKTILAMQVRGAVTERWNKEIIWGETHQTNNQLQQASFPAFTPTHMGGGVGGGYAPTLNALEAFYTKNGVPVEEDKDWVRTDLMGIRTATADDRWYIRQNYKTLNLHFDREARFYSSVIFDGGTFYGNSRLENDNTVDPNYMWVTDLTAIQLGTSARSSSTGYKCKKNIHYFTSIPDNTTAFNPYRYAYPIIRLADLYLMYAEALNEYESAPTDDVYKYIDLVRKRTGLQGVKESWADHSLIPNKPLSKTGMRDIIRRERLSELAFEGHRLWDLKRWKLAEEYLNRPVRGITRNYEVNDLWRLKFGKKDYFFPLRISSLMNSPNLVQSPYWE